MPIRKPQTMYSPGDIIACLPLNSQYQMSIRDSIANYMEIEVGDWITAIQGAEDGVIILEKYKGEFEND